MQARVNIKGRNHSGAGLVELADPRLTLFRLEFDFRKLFIVYFEKVTHLISRRISLMPNIGGSVLWIERGRQTEKVVDAERAFSDEDQAKAQVLFFEKKGSAAEKKLARLAFRQWQGKRFRQN